MKKILAAILTTAILSTAVIVPAMADNNPGGGQPPQQQSQQMGKAPDQGRGPQQKQGGQKQEQAPQQKRGEETMGAQQGKAPDQKQNNNGGKAPQQNERQDMNRQQPPEKPSGEQNQAMPGKPANDQAPTDGQQPPEMPSGDQDQAMPGEPESAQAPTDGQQPTDGTRPENMPMGGMIDFDALVESGTISQETCDKIKTYMEEHKPTDSQQPPEMPADGQQPSDGQQPPEMPADGQQPTDSQQPPEMPADGQQPSDGQRTGLLDELLSAGVITQEEYDAISAAMPTGSQMPGMGQNGQMPGMPGGMPGDSANVEYTAATTVTENADGATYTSSADSENAVLVSGDAVDVTNATITKTGSSSGESADFNGVNAAVLAKDGATLSATNSEAVVIKGGNSVTLDDVDITGSNTTLNGQSTQ